jgi:hypothetical protein
VPEIGKGAYFALWWGTNCFKILGIDESMALNLSARNKLEFVL